MEQLDVKIKLDAHGHGQVLVNGEDWGGRVQAVHLNSTAGDPAYLTLTLWPTSLEIEAPAHVNVVPVAINVVGHVLPSEKGGGST